MKITLNKINIGQGTMPLQGKNFATLSFDSVGVGLVPTHDLNNSVRVGLVPTLNKKFGIFLILFLLSFNLNAQTFNYDNIVKKTLSHNYKLKEIDENIYQSEILIDKAYTFLQPIISAGGRFTINNVETKMSFPNIDTKTGRIVGKKDMIINEKYAYGFNARLNYTLLNLRAWPLVKVAKNMKNIKELSKKLVISELKFAIAQLYINSLILTKSVELNDLAKNNLKKHLEFVKSKIELKEGLEIEKLRVETQIAKFNTDIAKLDGMNAQLKSQLANLMGIDDYSFDLEELSFEFKIDQLNKIFKIAKSKRVENKLSKKELLISKLMLDNIYMKFAPTIFLQANWNWNNAKGFTGKNSSWNINFMLNFPIYDGGIRFKEIKEEKSKIRAVKLKEKEFNDKLKQNIKSILIEIDNKKLSLDQIKNELNLAKKTLELAKEGYKLGVTKNIDVLDATLNINMILHKEMIEKLNINILYLKLKKELGIL